MNTKELLKIFSALSDTTRFRIVEVLFGGERCVCEIYPILNLSQPKVSRHLAYLRKSGLVQFRKDGLWKYYSLNNNIIRKYRLGNVFNIKIISNKNKKGCCGNNEKRK